MPSNWVKGHSVQKHTQTQTTDCSVWTTKVIAVKTMTHRQHYDTQYVSYSAVLLPNAFNKLLGAARYVRVYEQNLKLRHSANNNRRDNKASRLFTVAE